MDSRLLETILIQDGKVQNIAYHNKRFNASRNIFWGKLPEVNLIDFIHVPTEFTKGKVKCRVLYQADIEHIEFNIYVPKKIERLKLVATEMDYQYKWEDRTQINELVNTQPLYDDVLLTKNGLVTDTSYANIIFKKDNEFYTPKSPLLKGTKRQQLLDEEILIEKNIRANEVYKFSHFALINALNDLDLTQFIPTKNIFK